LLDYTVTKVVGVFVRFSCAASWGILRGRSAIMVALVRGQLCRETESLLI
jgi:hypothetical protein